jgi:hypothetical protein
MSRQFITERFIALKSIDISRKSKFTVAHGSEIHISPQLLMPESPRLPETDHASSATF